MTKNIRNLYLFTGVENKSTRLVEIQKDLGTKLETVCFFGDEMRDKVKLENLFTECRTNSFFYPYKLVQINDIEKVPLDSKDFRKLFEGVVKTTIIALLTSKSLKEIREQRLQPLYEYSKWIAEKGGEILDEKKASIGSAISFLKRGLKKSGVEASEEILKLLVETRLDSLEVASLGDFLKLLIEAKKYTREDSVLGLEDLEMFSPGGFSLGFSSYSGRDPRTVFVWIDRLFSKEAPPFLGLEASSMVLPLIFRQLKMMWEFRALSEGKSRGEHWSRMKIPSFLVGKIRSQSENFSIERIEELLCDLADLDSSLKSEEKGIFQIRFELYIIKIRSWIKEKARMQEKQKKGVAYVQN